MELILKFLLIFLLSMCTNKNRAKQHSEILLHALLVSIPLQDNIIKINLSVKSTETCILNSYYSGLLFIDVLIF